MATWIDIHTHLNMIKGATPEQTISEGQAAGVERFITIGTEPNDLPVVLEIAKRHFPTVACTLGVHPHEGSLYNDSVEEFLEKNVDAREVVAVGEIGLDYHYDNSPREEQKVAFRRQMDLAARHGLPVEIHTRDAEPDTIEILKEYKGRVGGVIHCFTGTMELARAALDCGFDISISGVVTFKNAEELRSVVKFVPLDRLHVETDAPFLAPVPMRGKPNVPAYVVHTARAVASLKGVTEEELALVTLANARRTFPKLFA